MSQSAGAKLRAFQNHILSSVFAREFCRLSLMRAALKLRPTAADLFHLEVLVKSRFR
jgi:hypothetical protein